MTDTESDLTDHLEPNSTSRRAPARDKQAAFLRRIPITDEMRERLRAEVERTGTGAMRLLRGAKDKPPGLSASVVGTWLSGVAKQAVPAHFDYVLSRLAALGENRRIPMTAAMGAEIESELARTGIGPTALLRLGRNAPADLTDQILTSWMSDERRPNSASESHWSFAMTTLRALPDRQNHAQGYVRKAYRKHAKIDPDMLAELRHHRERTGIGASILLRRAADKPAALTPTMVSNWINGVVENADPDLVAYVLAFYRAWP